MSTYTRTRLAEVRRPLLQLHRALIEASLVDHERRHRRVEGTNRIDLVRTNPAFAWLRPISELVMRIDEALDDEAAALEPLLAETARRSRPPSAATSWVSATSSCCRSTRTPSWRTPRSAARSSVPS
jgi:hypothetical protein